MTATVSNALEQKPQPIVLLDVYEDRFAAILPDHVETRGFIGSAAGALYGDAQLMKAAQESPGSFAKALIKCATKGHLPGTEEFYLVPRRNKGKLEVQGIEGYRGIVERMYRSGAVASVIVREVCEHDKFEFVEGEHDKPIHKVDWFGSNADRGEIIGVYAYAILTTGKVSRVVLLNRDDIAEIEAKSDGASSEFSPWKRNRRAMIWKSGARRLEPWVPTSAEYRREIMRAAAEANRAPEVNGQPSMAGFVDLETGEIHEAEIVEEIPWQTSIPEDAA